MSRVLVIGHCCYDRIGEDFVLGGTVSYVSLAARKLGAQVDMVSSFKSDFKFWELFKERGISVYKQLSNKTTTFHNQYYGVERKQILEAKADNISNEFISRLGLTPSIVLLAPIADEIDFSIVGLFPQAFKVATIQGALRKWDELGSVSYKEMDWLLLKNLDLVILSEEDINYEASLLNEIVTHQKHVVLTKADKGCEVYFKGKTLQFPAEKVKPVDFTGAGDVFAVSYILAFTNSNNVSFSARFANCAAANFISGFGISSLPDLLTIKGLMFSNK